MEVTPAPRSVSPRKNSQEDIEPPEPAMPASSDIPTSKTNGHSHDEEEETIVPVVENGNDEIEDEPLQEESKPLIKDATEAASKDDMINCTETAKESEVDSADVLDTPVKKPRTKTSRSQRELSNLVIDTPKKEEPVVDENVPRSRFGRVHKPKGEVIGSASKKRVSVKEVPSTSKAALNGTPVKPPKETKRPSSALSSSPPVITSAPKRRVVYFNTSERIKCSRAELLRIPDKDKDAEFSVGDLLWSKITGYPFWPCMITINPLENRYTRLDATTEELVYHVQYFGDESTRGWTRPKNIIAFQGLEKYKELGDPKNNPTTSTPQSAKKGKKPNNKYAIESKYRKLWEAAVAEAEFAFKLNPQERIEIFTFDYKIKSVPEVKESQKRKVLMTPSSGPSKAKRTKKGQSSPEDVYDFESDDQVDDLDIPSSPFKLLSAKKKGDFKIYKLREMERVKKEHHRLNAIELETLLKTKWGYLSDDQKAVYVDRSKNEDSPSKEDKKEPEPLKLVLTPRVKTVQPKTPASLRAKPTPKNTPSSVRKASPATKASPAKADKVTEVEAVPAKKVKSSPRKATSPSKTEAVKPVPLLPPPTTTAAKIPKKRAVESSDQESQAESVESSEFYDETTSQSETASETDGEQVKIPLDEVCFKCFTRIEAGLDFVSCSGPCLRTYHTQCVPVSVGEETTASQQPYKCSECLSGKHSCFICSQVTVEKKGKEESDDKMEVDSQTEEKPQSDAASEDKSSSETAIKCSESSCGRFYHASCLTSAYPFKMEKGSTEPVLKCPLHFCLTCHNDFLEDNIYRSMKRKLLTCVQCPTAYHFMNDCLAAGSTVLVNNKYILCPEHLEKTKASKKSSSKKTKSAAAHINVSFCFACMKGGELICCEKCPAAFHKDCLEFEIDEGSFNCPSCTKRKQLRYGEIIWAKVGNYRWWPSRIVQPSEVPDNVYNKSFANGEFVAYFYGSHDYSWIDKRRVFVYEEGDSLKSMSSGSGNMDKQFKQGLIEAKEAFAKLQSEKLSSLQLKVKKWPPYKHIRTNKPVGDVKIPDPPTRTDAVVDEPLNKCECDPKSDAPCSSDEDCLNRLMMIECSPKTCRAGDKCCNQRFKKRENARTKPFNTGSRGWGLKALDDIKKGQFVIEYVGELISESECDRRLETKVKNGENCFYFLTMDKNCIIDAGPSGNLARFMNHSCDPNCKTVKWVVDGTFRIGLFAVRDITAGEELTFNYNLSARGQEKTVCGCGASNCSNFIGLQPKKQLKVNASATPKTQKKSKTSSRTTEKRKEKKAAQKEFEELHEDLCFSCGEPGELIMCDRKGCPKSYDLPCLQQETIPRGKWECPWHHCDDCGKNATQFCARCPSSFCTEHKNENFKQISGEEVCPVHDEVEKNDEEPPKDAPEAKQEEDRLE